MNIPTTNNRIDDKYRLVSTRWESYLANANIHRFTEFMVAVNSLTESFRALKLPGLMRLSESLENLAANHLHVHSLHPLPSYETDALKMLMDGLATSISVLKPNMEEQRNQVSGETELTWVKPRTLWIISPNPDYKPAKTIAEKLSFFGFSTSIYSWGDEQDTDEMPLAVLFLPLARVTSPDELHYISQLRQQCSTSQLIYLGEETTIDPIVSLMRLGIDITIPLEEQPSVLLNCILDLVKSNDEEKFRVLIVEDSKVSVTLIERTLREHDIDSYAINDPGRLLEALQNYRPDLILMDMYMPRFNGVEATRVIRQMPMHRAIPIVYVSGESEVNLQVEALRLGGDQFLTKPVNPVLLAAIVKTKIERFRESQRSSRVDSLTNLLNHSTSKSRLKAMVEQIQPGNLLTVAMIDIDRFKSINDTFGHPVGDQVIRGLSWLLKGHLRTHDLIGRYGGEEFIIALPGVGLEQSKAVIDRIRLDFSALPHPHTSGSLYATFSAGICTLDFNSSAADLIERADNALLQAKRLGRNRVETAA